MLPTITAIFLSISIALGAIGTHLLSNVLTPKALTTFETATFYLLCQSIAILCLSVSHRFASSPILRKLLWLSFIGAVIFSGSLYLYLITKSSFLIKITPIGGVFMILTWFFVGIYLLKNRNIQEDSNP